MFFNKNKGQGAIEAPFKKSCTQKAIAQGAIEYLLVLGAAIIVVAIVIILITGVTSSAPRDTETTTDAQKQLQYSTIGYAINVEPGEEKTFVVDVDTQGKKLGELFPNLPTNLVLEVNETSAWDIDEWRNNYDNYTLKPGDKLVFYNDLVTEKINIKIKGDYVDPNTEQEPYLRISPQEINCTYEDNDPDYTFRIDYTIDITTNSGNLSYCVIESEDTKGYNQEGNTINPQTTSYYWNNHLTLYTNISDIDSEYGGPEDTSFEHVINCGTSNGDTNLIRINTDSCEPI